MSQEDERTRSYSRKLILYRRADKHGIDGEEKMQKQSMMIYRQLLSYRDLLRRNARKLLGSKAFLSEKSKLCKPWWDQARPRTQGQCTGNQIWSISLMFLTVVKAASLNLWFMFLALPDWGNVLSTENKQDYSSKQYRPVAILLWGYFIEQPGGVWIISKMPQPQPKYFKWLVFFFPFTDSSFLVDGFPWEGIEVPFRQFSLPFRLTGLHLLYSCFLFGSDNTNSTVLLILWPLAWVNTVDWCWQ